MADFYIKRNDTLPAITATLQDSNGVALNLSGATVKFIMKKSPGTTTKVDAAATVVSASLGQVSYTWIAADTDTAGDYNAEWQVTYGGGAIATVPNDGYITVKILADLGS